MMDMELLHAIGTMLDERLKPIEKRMERMERDIHETKVLVENTIPHNIRAFLKSQRSCTILTK